MPLNPTLEKLQALRLHGMIKALGEQHATPDINELGFDERLGLMVDRELTERENAHLSTRLLDDWRRLPHRNGATCWSCWTTAMGTARRW
jgi:hypothetical protein